MRSLLNLAYQKAKKKEKPLFKHMYLSPNLVPLSLSTLACLSLKSFASSIQSKSATASFIFIDLSSSMDSLNRDGCSSVIKKKKKRGRGMSLSGMQSFWNGT